LHDVSKTIPRDAFPIIYPAHPRARKNIENGKIKVPAEIELIDPLSYTDFLALMKHSALVLTDSGGIQEECCIMRIPCVTLRYNTERPETIKVNSNILAGTKSEDILYCAKKMLTSDGSWPNPFGDGTASAKILDALKSKMLLGSR